MKRWFYIFLGGLGFGLALACGFMIWWAPQLPPPYNLWLTICEYVFIPLGVVLGVMGFINGREAGEFNIAEYKRSSRKRDHHVSGTEIEFACPICHKIYRASPLLAGKPFNCRDCREVFEVPGSSPPPPPPSSVNQQRLLPEPA